LFFPESRVVPRRTLSEAPEATVRGTDFVVTAPAAAAGGAIHADVELLSGGLEVGEIMVSGGHEVRDSACFGRLDVDRSVLTHPKEIAFGVAHPEKVRSRDRLVLRFSLEEDQLRRRVAHEDRGHAFRRELLSGKARLHLFPVVVVR
jgi:hypothetical protein